MARLRASQTSGDDATAVPSSLLDWDAAAWRDPDEFRRWVKAHLAEQPTGRRLEVLCGSPDDVARWRFAVDAWAVENGFGQDNRPRLPDWGRLEQVGVRRMKSLEYARRRRLIVPPSPSSWSA